MPGEANGLARGAHRPSGTAAIIPRGFAWVVLLQAIVPPSRYGRDATIRITTISKNWAYVTFGWPCGACGILPVKGPTLNWTWMTPSAVRHKTPAIWT